MSLEEGCMITFAKELSILVVYISPKGNQPWIFFGRTDTEVPKLWPPDAKSHLIGKDWETQRAGREAATEGEMVGRRHQHNGYETEQTLGDSEGQGSLACRSPWGHEESETTEQLNNISQSILVHWLHSWEWKQRPWGPLQKCRQEARESVDKGKQELWFGGQVGCVGHKI